MVRLGDFGGVVPVRVSFSLLGGAPHVAHAEFHVRREARDALAIPDSLFSARGDVIFSRPRDAFELAEALARPNALGTTHVRPAELHAMGLVHEVLHALIALYRKNSAPSVFTDALAAMRARVGEDALERTLLRLVETFPPPSVYRGEETAVAFLTRSTDGVPHAEWALEELILLYISNENLAYRPISALVSDASLRASTPYLALIEETRLHLAAAPAFGPEGESLFDVLLAPMRHSPHSIFGQLEHMRARFGLQLEALGVLDRLLLGLDLLHEEHAWFERKSHTASSEAPARPPEFGGELYEHEGEKFSPDVDWMPRVVMMAKSTFVWLDQLSKTYGRPIRTLADIPDEVLATLSTRGFTALWLIGVWQRSAASREIKRRQGNTDALASAYSLHAYEVAPELGGAAALDDLSRRAARFGIRLASDMVPNHMGLDSSWVNEHPEWFIQADEPPFPGYRFDGPDLGSDPRIGIYLEDGYWSRTDAAVVFKRWDRQTGETRYLYHGNDGTSMPWNDTAQLDYLRSDVREAVMQTILHVARQFPIIRFDAAMTLAKRHYQRLWFPLPGTGGSIPSRAERALTRERFDELYPVEFWREVVDRVAAEVPGTLLLAEAFWMMEGYFVRTLGMHRVYNSAFMNMLKREENANYRLTIRNVLEFNPQILKRFVNFMNNPDEEPAVAQFGKDDKYFGVCVLLATMPGLPMFGHGQVEGFGEKYGMEFARAQWNESPDPWLVARHEREIFPLLNRRPLFSEVALFLLYDFTTPEGAVDEDVFAYSNGAGDARALVVFHNRYKETRGVVRDSVGFSDGSGAVVRRSLVEGLGVTVAPRRFLVMREHVRGLEHLVSTTELAERGLPLELEAFSYRIFWELREVEHTPERPYADLARALGGRGVRSISEALVEHVHRAVHVPFFEAINAGSARWLAEQASARRTSEVAATVREKLGHVVDGLRWMIDTGLLGPNAHPLREVHRELVAEVSTALERGMAALGGLPAPLRTRVGERIDGVRPEHLVVVWAFLEGAEELRGAILGRPMPRAGGPETRGGRAIEISKDVPGAEQGPARSSADVGAPAAEARESSAPLEPGEARVRERGTQGERPTRDARGERDTQPARGEPGREVLEAWHLGRVLGRALSADGASDESAARTVSRLGLLPGSHSDRWRDDLAALALNPRFAEALEVHVWEGTRWFRAERFAELVCTMFLARASALDSGRELATELETALDLGARTEYRFDALLAALRSAGH